MGMAASQARLLQLTNRKNTIGRELSSLSLQKMSLTREMSKVSKDYQEALNTKTLKWSNNSGVTYVDLSYQNLMTPSSMNQQTPYLITDSNGKIVVDSSYQKYAEMVSADGKAGGDWLSVRTEVISSLTGIPADSIDNLANYETTADENLLKLQEIEDTEPERPTKQTSIVGLLEKMGSSTGTSSGFSDASDWASAYSNGSTISLGSGSAATSSLTSVLNHIANTLGYYFDDTEGMQEACQTFLDSMSTLMNQGQDLSSNAFPVKGNNDGYSINVTEMIEEIMGAYTSISGNGNTTSSYGTTLYDWYDRDSTTYKNWETNHAAWESQYEEALQAYNDSESQKNTLLTADQESQIEFYDTLFSSIAEKGWTYNSQVSDTDYLNQMLQNNLYTITTVNREKEYDSDAGEYIWENSYETDIASNFTNVYSVNDSGVQNEAMAEYEYEKNIINQKESRIDTRMQDLETEQSAINQMIQGIEQVKNDNIDRNFSIFT